MSEWITFYDKPSAIEYIKKKQRDGYSATYEHIGNEYRVKLKENKGFKIEGQVFEDEGEKFIVYSKKPNTHLKLHELGHINTEQQVGGIYEMVDNELRAEKWARDKQGKTVAPEDLINIVARVKEKSKVLSKEESLKIVLDRMKENNIDISNKDKADLEYLVENGL